MENYFEANRKMWDELAVIHYKSKFYDVEGFKAGKLSLFSIERKELGDITGKSLLHLMCHFGMDTLSWAKLGAKVTGVDFSEKAIELARALSKETGIEGNFICANIYDLPKVLSEEFDIVFTSYGVLTWLPDLQNWATIIARFLKARGLFYMVELHPFTWIFQDEDVTELEVTHPYFKEQEPIKFEVKGSYADETAQINQEYNYEWPYSFSEILNSLINAGLKIQFVNEYPYCTYKMFPFMEKHEDGWWRLKNQKGVIPLMFSLKAIKEYKRREGVIT